MSPEEKLEMWRKLIAEAEAEIAAKKRNWPEKIEAGMLFRNDCGSLYIAHTCERGEVDNLVCVSGGGAGKNWVFRKFFDGGEAEFTYLGHARDLIKIADDAREPTGAELVGKMCQVSLYPINKADDGIMCLVTSFDPAMGYRTKEGECEPWKYARLAR